MASIALTIIGCIGYLNIGAILRVRCFHLRRQEQKIEFLFPAKKAQAAHWAVVGAWKALRLFLPKGTLQTEVFIPMS